MMTPLGRLATLLCLAAALGEVQDCSKMIYSTGCQRYPNKMVVMVQVGDDYIDFFKNWYEFAARHANPQCMKLVVMADDEATFRNLSTMKDNDAFKKWDLDVLDSEHEAQKAETQARESHKDPSDSALIEMPMPASWKYGSEAYKTMMSQRPRYISSLVAESCSVLFSDIDIVWLRNPFAEIEKMNDGQANMYITADSVEDTEKNRKHLPAPTYNGGFVFFQPTLFTQEVVKEWKDKLKRTPGPNQPALNAVLARKGMTGVAVLPGEVFKDRVRADARWDDAVLVHANWLVGHEEKLKWLQARDLWMPAEMEATRAAESSGQESQRLDEKKKDQEELVRASRYQEKDNKEEQDKKDREKDKDKDKDGFIIASETKEEEPDVQGQIVNVPEKMAEQERRKKAYIAQETKHSLRVPGRAALQPTGAEEPRGSGREKMQEQAEISSAAEVEISSRDA